MSDIDGQIKLRRLLRELAVSAPEPASGVMELRLRRACRERAARRRFRNIAIGVAACLMAACGWGWWHSELPVPLERSEYAGFMALPYAQSDVPIEQMVVVRVNVDAASLSALGLPAASFSGRKQASADLLIGQDGMARAVRFTQ